MQLCTAQPIISNLPHYNLPLFTSNFPASRISTTSIFCPSGLRYKTNLPLRSSFSDETSSAANPYAKDGPDVAVIVEETKPVEKYEYGESFPKEAPKEKSPDEETKPVEKYEYGENFPKEAPKEESPNDNQVLQFEFLQKLNIKFDSDNKYSIVLLGGGSLVALYITAAIVRAIDAIPLFPTLMQIVGLYYTLSFSSRYLLFKESREELAAKIEDIKLQVLGSDDD